MIQIKWIQIGIIYFKIVQQILKEIPNYGSRKGGGVGSGAFRGEILKLMCFFFRGRHSLTNKVFIRQMFAIVTIQIIVRVKWAKNLGDLCSFTVVFGHWICYIEGLIVTNWWAFQLSIKSSFTSPCVYNANFFLLIQL